MQRRVQESIYTKKENKKFACGPLSLDSTVNCENIGWEAGAPGKYQLLGN